MGRKAANWMGPRKLTGLVQAIFEADSAGEASALALTGLAGLQRAEQRLAIALRCRDAAVAAGHVEEAAAAVREAREALHRAAAGRAALGDPSARNGSPATQAEAVALTRRYLRACQDDC